VLLVHLRVLHEGVERERGIERQAARALEAVGEAVDLVGLELAGHDECLGL